MSQHDFNIANQTFPSFRSDLNDALQAAATISAGASAPTTPYAYQLWFDTSTNTYKARNAGNSAWISLFGNDLTNGGITFGDNDKAIFGAGSDLQIYHDGSDSYVKDAGSGNLTLQGTNLNLYNTALSKIYLNATDGGSVDLYYDNALKLATSATGCDITGGLTTTDFDVIPTGSANYYPQIGGGVDGGADAYLALSGGTSSNGNLAIQARGTYGEIKFYTGGSSGSASTTERLRILSTGGITFNGDTAAANALNDYEQGTYTATITPSSGSITLTYDQLKYTKIGRLVTVMGLLYVSTVSSPSGYATFNLPYAVSSGDDFSNRSAGAPYANNWVSLNANDVAIVATESNSVAYFIDISGTTVNGQAMGQQFRAGTEFFVTLTYHTNA